MGDGIDALAQGMDGSFVGQVGDDHFFIGGRVGHGYAVAQPEAICQRGQATAQFRTQPPGRAGQKDRAEGWPAHVSPPVT
jgi:hypothetical protein